MKGRGLRGVLQPGIYLGIALSVHIALFFAPIRLPQTKQTLVRGVKVKTFVPYERPAPPPPRPSSPPTQEAPAAPVDVAGGSSAAPAQPPAPSAEPSAGPEPSEFGKYLAKLRSDQVQGWAKDSARAGTRGLAGSKSAKRGWGFGEHGAAEGTSKGRSAGRPGTGTLDPRVQMVVTSYPPTSIEQSHGHVAYPDKKFKKHQYASGWWNVFIQINTDSRGNVVTSKVLRPDTDGPLQRIFIKQVQDEVSTWSFERQSAEINVDVRFYVE